MSSFKVNKFSLVKLVYLLLSITILIICFFDLVNSYKFYVYTSIFIFIFIFSMTIKYRNFSLYQIFLVTYFLFLLGRVFLDALGIYDVREMDLIIYSKISDDVLEETLRVIIEFLIGSSYGWLLKIRNNKEDRYVQNNVKKSQKLNKILKILFFIYFIVFLFKLFYTVQIVRSQGYATMYNGTLSDADFPIFFMGAGTISEILYIVIIYYNRDKTSFFRYSAFYIIIASFRILTGQRAVTFLMFIFVLYLYSTFYIEVKVINRRIILLILLAPIIIEGIAQYRIAQSVTFSSSLENNVYYLLLKNMGVSICVIAYMVKFHGTFLNRVPFMFGYFTDIFNANSGQSIEKIKNGNYLGDYLTYRLNSNAYLSGRGTGTSIVAEAYDLFNGSGFWIFVFAFLSTYIVLKICSKTYTSIFYFVFTYYLAKDFVYSPRWSLFKSITSILLGIIVCTVCKVMENKATIVNENENKGRK